MKVGVIHRSRLSIESHGCERDWLRDLPYTYRQMAEILGVSTKTICWWCSPNSKWHTCIPPHFVRLLKYELWALETGCPAPWLKH